MTIAVEGLTVTYRNRPAIHEVGFEARSGRVTGIIGPNGGGKSTTIKAMMGLLRPDSGSIMFDGQPLDEVRRTVAYLPQRLALDWDYPAQVRDVVAMGRYPHRRFGRPRSNADRSAIEEALDRVRLTDLAERQIGELSGGQQQRMLLARALAQQASTLLLDEPFAGIDAATVLLLTNLIISIAGAGGCVVVVNHDLETNLTMCDHAVLLNQRVVTQGPVASALTPDWIDQTYATDAARTGPAA